MQKRAPLPQNLPAIGHCDGQAAHREHSGKRDKLRRKQELHPARQKLEDSIWIEDLKSEVKQVAPNPARTAGRDRALCVLDSG